MSSFYDYVKERLQRYVTENLLGYHKIVETAKKYEDALCWNMVSVFDYNAVMKLKDGYLTSYTMSLDITHDAEAGRDSLISARKGESISCISISLRKFANQRTKKYPACLTLRIRTRINFSIC